MLKKLEYNKIYAVKTFIVSGPRGDVQKQI